VADEWRLLDTGVRNAYENLAMDETLLETKTRNPIPNTLRFLQFSPNAVLVGLHQNVDQEVRLDFCKEHNIDICRRITGGGAIYFDEPQLGWELIVDKSHPKIPRRIEQVYEVMCQGTIEGLKKLKVDAKFRPKNDIEVNGRKISGTGGAQDGNVLFFQGTLLTDFDVETMIKALRIPTEKLKDKELESVKERVTCLKWVLGETPELSNIKRALVEGIEDVFGCKLVEGDLTVEENKMFVDKLNKFSSQEWIFDLRRPQDARQTLEARYKTKGGLIRVSLVMDALTNQIQSSLITGDFTVYPKRTIFDLEAALKGTYAKDMEQTVLDFFDRTQPSIPHIEPGDFVKVISEAIDKLKLEQFGFTLPEANNIFTVVKPFEDINETPYLLLPYCAKLADCEFRNEKDCTVCGDCSVGDVWELCQEFGLKPITILNYEDLESTLQQLKDSGAPGFIGSCCEAFYVKHQEDFERIGLPGILIDIDNQTCYELGKARDAYLGKFENQTDLKVELIRKVIECIFEKR
jgi:lipoate-protein ligase A